MKWRSASLQAVCSEHVSMWFSECIYDFRSSTSYLSLPPQSHSSTFRSSYVNLRIHIVTISVGRPYGYHVGFLTAFMIVSSRSGLTHNVIIIIDSLCFRMYMYVTLLPCTLSGAWYIWIIRDCAVSIHSGLSLGISHQKTGIWLRYILRCNDLSQTLSQFIYLLPVAAPCCCR